MGKRIITGQGKRTFELDNNALRKLGLFDMRDSLSRQAGRPVNFVIFDSAPTAVNKKDAFSIVP